MKNVWGCNTDISHLKYTEGLKEQRLHDVLEAKRQSENFIDITSHELRNPLSAIIQCADGITSTLSSARKTVAATISTEIGTADLDSMLELAQTIALCAQHQTRIVNDILTLSKLDASLLTVSVVAVDPISTLSHALKLHQQELRNAKMTSSLDVQDSYRELDIERILLDPSRVLQVLINLITNAIKLYVAVSESLAKSLADLLAARNSRTSAASPFTSARLGPIPQQTAEARNTLSHEHRKSPCHPGLRGQATIISICS